MTQDHYQTLGVPRGASPDEIKTAYRKLASAHHPDKGGDTQKFQEIQSAYAVLSDESKRSQYDSPQMSGGPGNFHFEFGGGPQAFDFSSIFNMFGAQFQHPHAQRSQTRMSLWVTLNDVATGGRRPVTIGTQHGNMTVEIDIPLGINDGDHVQYAGIGPNNSDLIVNYRIHPNPKWQRNGLHLSTDYTIDIWSCVLGADVEIKDILNNQLLLTVPAGTQPSTVLRVKGKGLPGPHNTRGDLFVKIQCQIPQEISPELLSLIKKEQQK